MAVDTTELAKNYLIYFILPLWVIVGIIDWFCHRAARIEYSAGPLESVIHLFMLCQAGVAILFGLYCEINGLIVLIMLLAWAAHEVTGYWDLAYANAHRRITPVEQRVHDYLGVIPLLALSFVVVTHWPAFLSIFGLGDTPFDGSLRLRTPPVEPIYFWFLMAAMTVNLLLYLQELYRGIKAVRGHARPVHLAQHSR
jgi:hypothetical protein